VPEPLKGFESDLAYFRIEPYFRIKAGPRQKIRGLWEPYANLSVT